MLLCCTVTFTTSIVCVFSSQMRSTSGSVGNARKPCAGIDYRQTPNPTTNDTEITVCMSPCPTTGGKSIDHIQMNALQFNLVLLANCYKLYILYF